MSTALILLAIVTLILLFWFETLRMREYVIRRCKSTCEAAGLQLLDQSVALNSISMKRDRNGRWRVHRSYQFHVSENGTDRYPGSIILTGNRIEAVHIEGESGTTTLHQERPMRIH